MQEEGTGTIGKLVVVLIAYHRLFNLWLHGVIKSCPLCTYNLVRPVRIALFLIL